MLRKKGKKIKGCLHTNYLASVYYFFCAAMRQTHCSLLAGKVIDRTIEYYVKSAHIEITWELSKKCPSRNIMGTMCKKIS